MDSAWDDYDKAILDLERYSYYLLHINLLICMTICHTDTTRTKWFEFNCANAQSESTKSEQATRAINLKMLFTGFDVMFTFFLIARQMLMTKAMSRFFFFRPPGQKRFSAAMNQINIVEGTDETAMKQIQVAWPTSDHRVSLVLPKSWTAGEHFRVSMCRRPCVQRSVTFEEFSAPILRPVLCLSRLKHETTRSGKPPWVWVQLSPRFVWQSLITLFLN